MGNQDAQFVTMEQSFRNNILVTFRSSREVKWGRPHKHYRQSFHVLLTCTNDHKTQWQKTADIYDLPGPVGQDWVES